MNAKITNTMELENKQSKRPKKQIIECTTFQGCRQCPEEHLDPTIPVQSHHLVLHQLRTLFRIFNVTILWG